MPGLGGQSPCAKSESFTGKGDTFHPIFENQEKYLEIFKTDQHRKTSTGLCIDFILLTV